MTFQNSSNPSNVFFQETSGTLDLSSNVQSTGINSWNGNILQTVSVSVTSDGATITLSVEQSGSGDLTVVFSDGFDDWDTSPADTVSLTAGSDTSPQINYVYYLQSTKTLTNSTSSFPDAEHAPIATVVCQSAASLQTDGCYKCHVWTDHLIDVNNQGHMSDVNAWIRDQNGTWIDGVAQTYTITANGGAADNVILTTASGNVRQLHSHVFPAFSGTPDVYVVNDNATPFNKITDLNGLLTDSTGASMSGKFFSLVIWGVVSEDTADCKLYCNLPGGSYNNANSLTEDVSKFANFDIPSDFKGAAFLISQWNLRHQAAASGTWTSIDELDLRGQFPSITAGGGTSPPSEFIDNTFRILDEGDNTKEIAFQASGITAATTRTITAADQNIDMTPTTGSYQASDAGLTDIAGLAVTNSNFIVGDGANWVAETGATARTSLGLGTIATQASNSVSITGGSVTGITDIVVADGGTGLSSATAYAVLCGGTTSTAAFQSIAGVGTSGQVLTSNGAAALPTFQAAAAGGGTQIQQIRASTSAVFDIGTAIPYDDSIPQQTEGDEILTVTITPGATDSILIVEAFFTSEIDRGSVNGTAALFRDATANAIAATSLGETGSSSEDVTGGHCIRTFVTSGSTDATTFKLRCGVDNSTGMSVNGSLTNRRYGGVAATTLFVTEYSS